MEIGNQKIENPKTLNSNSVDFAAFDLFLVSGGIHQFVQFSNVARAHLYEPTHSQRILVDCLRRGAELVVDGFYGSADWRKHVTCRLDRLDDAKCLARLQL